MKKLLILVIMMLIGLMGCKKPQPELPDDDPFVMYISNATQLINAITTPISLDSKLELAEAWELIDMIPEARREEITNLDTLYDYQAQYNALLEAEADQAQQKQQAILANFKTFEANIIQAIPDETIENVTLIKDMTFDGEIYRAVYGSSAPNFFSRDGEVKQSSFDCEVVIYVLLAFENERYDFRKAVRIPKLALAPLPQTNLVFGYVYSTDLRPAEIQATDVVNVSFAYIDPESLLVDASSIAYQLSKAADLRKQGVRVVVSIQGYHDGAIYFSRAARTAERRSALAASIVNLIKQYGLDGVDIDWEYPGFYTLYKGEISEAEDKANYTRLIQEIHRQVKALDAEFLVTAAIPGSPTARRFDLYSLQYYLDYVHFMSYDYNYSSQVSHHTALGSSSLGIPQYCYLTDEYQDYLAKGFPKEKIIIGVAFYGKEFVLEPGSTSYLGTVRDCQTIFYAFDDDLRRTIVKDYLPRIGNGVEYIWDDGAQAPLLYDKKNNMVVSYDDEQSIASKVNFIKTNGLSGLMVWNYHEDTSDRLINAIYNNLKK